MCCCNCKSRETIDIEVWPGLLRDSDFSSVIRDAIEQVENCYGPNRSAEVRYVGSRYISDLDGNRSLVHKFTATSPGIR